MRIVLGGFLLKVQVRLFIIFTQYNTMPPVVATQIAQDVEISKSVLIGNL